MTRFCPPFKGGLPKKLKYLHEHFRYPVQRDGYTSGYTCANNVKLPRLHLTRELIDVAYRLIEAGTTSKLIEEENQTSFFYKHPDYAIGINGRSYGYLVLHQSTLRTDGMRIYTSRAPRDLEFADSWPYDYKLWKALSIRERTQLLDQRDLIEALFVLVRDFDQACDNIVKRFTEECISYQAHADPMRRNSSNFVADGSPILRRRLPETPTFMRIDRTSSARN